MLRRWLPSLAIELALIASLSAVCGYELTRPGYIVNFEIATMLTPYGLGKNVVVQPENPLRRFYDREPDRKGVADSATIAMLASAASAFELFMLFRLKRNHK